MSYLSDFVYGAIDGTVTTFAVVSGVAGAQLSPSVVLILGMANLFADGFSMAASNYVSSKTENSEQALAAEYEKQQIENDPGGETEEIRQMFLQKGLEGSLLNEVVKSVISDKKRWLSIMLQEEYGFAIRRKSPIRSASATFAAFVIAGAIPLLPFVLNVQNAFRSSILLTGTAFFIIGSLKSIWTIEKFWVAGLKTLAIGSAAASVAYAVGHLLKNISG